MFNIRKKPSIVPSMHAVNMSHVSSRNSMVDGALS